MKVKSLKPLRYGTQFVETGTIGEALEIANNVFTSYINYDYYVSFNNGKAFGVFKEEIEVIKE